MFCKFVIKIRHLSIKIIYASRTGQMIVLYNPINSNNPDQNQITNYAFYLCIPRIYNNYLYYIICTFGQCVNNPDSCLIHQHGGILHFENKRSLPYPGDGIYSHLSPKIHPTEVPQFHHPQIVSNSRTIHKTTSITTSTRNQKIP